MHQDGVDAGESLQGGVLGWDVGHLPRRPGRLGRQDPLLVVKGVEEVAERIRRGQLALQEAAESPVGLEHGDVVEAVPAGREQEDQGLELLTLGVAALPRADVDVLPDHPRQAQGAHRFQDQG
jgi:hypothetical protein